MDKSISINANSLSYYTVGRKDSPALLLLHGYLETGLIWKDFIPLLSNQYYIICPDIPGHGKSGVIGQVHEMEMLARALDEIIIEEEVEKFHIVGHSMGGYLSLAYRRIFPEKLLSCVLFHSTCFPDTDEKKSNRDREIEFIRKGKKELIFNTNIPTAFADDNHKTHSYQIEFAKEVARSNSEEGIIALLEGMKIRKDSTDLIRETNIPYLLIAGEKDNYIPIEIMLNIKKLGINIELQSLENSGHMGFMEEPEKSAEILTSFFQVYDLK